MKISYSSPPVSLTTLDSRYLNITGDTITGQLVSTLAIGTSPFAVTSTTVNTNLNADLLDGQHANAFLTAESDPLALKILSNLSDLNNVGTARTNLGLIAGGTGDIWVEKAGDTMTGNLTISNTAPSLVLTDTTASAKSLTIAVDANIVDLRESAGASGSLLVLDLANGRVGIGTTGPTTKLEVVNAASSQLRLSYTTGSVYSDIYTNSNGYLYLDASGGRIYANDPIRVSELWDIGADLTIKTVGSNRSIVFNPASGGGSYFTSGNVGIGTTGPRAKLDISTGYLVGTGLQLPHIVNKVASANVRNTHNAEATSTSATYVKVKTITLTNGLVGQQRFLFDIKTSDILVTTYGKIYRNGVALGTEQTSVLLTYATKSEDITQTWNPGDTCELWVHSDGAATVSIQNFQIAYDDAPTTAVLSANS